MTVFEGARLIVGDGAAPIENSAFIVANNRFTQVGRRGQLNVPAGATRVDLTGKTVMPAIVDTHTHMPVTRDALVDSLQRKAYYGVGVVMSLGQDTGDVAFQVREETIPGAARLRTAGRGITMPEPGRTEAPYWVSTEAEGRKAVQELAARKVDIVKIWVDDRDGKYKKLSPALYGPIIDEAHKNKLRVTAHIFTLEDAKGLLRAGIDGFAHGVRDKDIDDEVVALFKQRPNVFVVPNLPDRGVKDDLSWLSDSVPAGELAKLQAAATDRPAVQQTFGIQARNLARLNKAGVRIALGTDGNVRLCASPRDGGYGRERNDTGAGHRGLDARRPPRCCRLPGRRHGRDRQERGLPRARREPAGQHHEHAANLVRVSQGHSRRSRGDEGQNDAAHRCCRRELKSTG